MPPFLSNNPSVIPWQKKNPLLSIKSSVLAALFTTLISWCSTPKSCPEGKELGKRKIDVPFIDASVPDCIAHK